MVTNAFKWYKEILSDSFILVPFPKEKLEIIEWFYCLATIDVCALNHGTKFCNKDGNDIIPFWMVEVINNDGEEVQPLAKEGFHHD